MATVRTLVATPAPVSISMLVPTPIPVAPGSGGAVGVTPADAVSIRPAVSYARGAFTLTGAASSAAGVAGVEITATLGDGSTADLGAATVSPDGSFTFSDRVGSGTQGVLTATETDGAGGTASAQAPYALAGGLRGAYRAEQDSYGAAGSAVAVRRLFGAGGQSSVDVEAPEQTVDLGPFAIVQNHHRAGTQFVFSPGDGLDVIRGFVAGGAGHGTLELPSADIRNFADVLRNTGDIAGSAFVTDPLTGDAVRLAGVTAAELKPKDIAFVA